MIPTIYAGLLPCLLLIVWYGVANSRWYKGLAALDPTVRVPDPLVDPVGWLGGGPTRLARLVGYLRTEHPDPSVETWRIRTVRRFAVCTMLGPLALVGAPLTTTALVTFVDAVMTRQGPTGLLMVLIGLGVFAYYSYRLVWAAWRYGNGQSVRRTEFVLSLLGVAGTTAGLLFVAAVPFASG